MDNLFESYMDARCLIKSQKRIIEEFKSGKRYLKLQADHDRIYAGYIKEIKHLKSEVGKLNARMISNRNMLLDDLYALYDEKQAEIIKLQETNRKLEDQLWELSLIHI